MAFLALRRFGLEYPYAAESDYYNWILNGLREFWEIATVLRLAAQAFSKQYCLTPSRARGSCIAWASFKTGAPKLSAALIFLWLLSFYQEKESNNDFLKYSTVLASPVSASTFGDQSSTFFASEISGLRCFGSSWGRGR